MLEQSTERSIEYMKKRAFEIIDSTPMYQYKGSVSKLLGLTVEGVVCERDRVFSVQYHPESAPGPQDSTYLFDQFITLIKEGCQHAEKNRS